jgi:hypothetical protein
MSEQNEKIEISDDKTKTNEIIESTTSNVSESGEKPKKSKKSKKSEKSEKSEKSGNPIIGFFQSFFTWYLLF